MITIKFGQIEYEGTQPWAIGMEFAGWWLYFLFDTGDWFLSSRDLFIGETKQPTFRGILPNPPKK